MRRREFITVLGGAATWSIAARAQQPAVPVIAFFSSSTANAATINATAFRKGLSEAGYIEGQNVLIEYHGLESQFDRLPALMANIVQRRVDVIVTPGSNPATLAAKTATSTIPVVFGIGEDPVALGLVASLARPGGNMTGINYLGHEVNAKRLGLMRELLPEATRYAVLVNPRNSVSTEAAAKSIKQAASALGIEPIFVNASTPAEIDAAFAAFARAGTEALFIAPDGFFNSRRVQLSTLASRDRIPTSVTGRQGAEAGLLMSYGSNVSDMFRQVGVYAGSILNGAKPAELPVIQATKFEFVINLQTARSLDLDIPPMLLARADEVIE